MSTVSRRSSLDVRARAECATAPLALAFLVACADAGPATLTHGGVRVARVQSPAAAGPGELVAARGDWVFTGAGLRAVIGGEERSPSQRGAILELSRTDSPRADALSLAPPRLEIDGLVIPIEVTRFRAVGRSGRPALRIEGVARIGRSTLRVDRELAIAPTGEGVESLMRISSATNHVVKLLERVRWGGAAPFLPGFEGVTDREWRAVPWVGVEGRVLGAVVTVDDDTIEVRAEYEVHGTDRFLDATDIRGEPHSIGTGASAISRTRVTLAADGGLGQALRRQGWMRGRHFPEITVTLPYEPAGSFVELRDNEERLWLRARAIAHGRAILPIVPLGTPSTPTGLTVVASAYGHAPSDPVEVVLPASAPLVAEIPRGGRVRVRIRDAADDTPIPARVRIVGVPPTASPNLGPDHAAGGAGDAVLVMDGEAIVDLAPGRYRVVVTHGLEWELHEQVVEVTRTLRPDVRARLTRAVDPGEWVGCDFHVHAAPSPDSEVALDDRVASLVAEGVRFAVPTDHNVVTDYAPVAVGPLYEQFGTIPGVEVTTEEPPFGHFNVFPWALDLSLPGNGAPVFRTTTPDRLFATAHAAGPDVVVQVNHPRLEGDIGYFDRTGFDPLSGAAHGPIVYSQAFDLLEVWNGFDLARPSVFDRVFREWLALIARGHRVVATGNSDSHRIRYHWAGYPRTYVRVPGGDVRDGIALVRALRGGAAFVTSGPFLEATIDGEGPGATVVSTTGRVDLRVIVRAPTWVDVTSLIVFHGDAEVRRETITRDTPPRRARNESIPVVRYDATISLAVDEDGPLVVLVRGDRPIDAFLGRADVPPIAFTNPIWIDADVPLADTDAGIARTPTPSSDSPSPAPPPSTAVPTTPTTSGGSQ